MALSNWDTLTINEKGESIDGVYEFHSGVVAELYKSKLHILDEKAWVEESTYTKPIVLGVEKGALNYIGINIFAVRDNEINAIYFAVWSGYDFDNSVLGMIGIGTYGYAVDIDYKTGLVDSSNENDYIGVRDWQIGKLKKIIDDDNNGVGDNSIPDVFNAIDFTKVLRKNQGDMYLNDREGTKVGDASQTIFSQLLGW